MPSFRRRESVIDANRVDEPPQDPDRSADAADALSLAEEAEAEAAEAEATAAAARARARAIRLRRHAQATATEVEAEAVDVDSDPTDVEDVVAEPVEEAEADEAQAAPEEVSAPAGRRWGFVLKVVAMTMASLCTIALIAVSVFMVMVHRHRAADQQLRAEYSAAGRQSVVTLMSLDFNKAKDDVQRIIDNSTGEFRDDFKNQAEDFIKVAQESKVITEVTVSATAVESMTDQSAVVLVSASSRVTNAAGAKQEPRSWRLSVDLQRDGGQIKMSKVEFVP